MVRPRSQPQSGPRRETPPIPWSKRSFTIGCILLALILLLLPAGFLAAENPILEPLPGADLVIKVLIVGQGDPVYLWYGHAAIVVENIRTRQVTNYDYGVFDFRQDHFYWNFAMGRLIYGVMATPLDWRIRQTESNRRNHTVYTLDIPEERRSALDLYLRTNVQPGNDSYLYHHYHDNCSTRIRDAIDFALEGEFGEWARGIPAALTFRQHIHRFSGNHIIIDWVLSFLQGASIDDPITLWDEMFLPSELESAILEFSYVDDTGVLVPLVAGIEASMTYPEDERPKIPEVREDVWYYPLVIGTILGLSLLLLGLLADIGRRSQVLFKERGTLVKFAYRLYTLLTGLLLTPVGLLGTVLLIMSLFTNHDVTYRNENLLLANPFTLWVGGHLLLSTFRKSPDKGRSLEGLLLIILAVLGVAYTGLKSIFPVMLPQDNLSVIMLVLPILIGTALAWIPVRR